MRQDNDILLLDTPIKPAQKLSPVVNWTIQFGAFAALVLFLG